MYLYLFIGYIIAIIYFLISIIIIHKEYYTEFSLTQRSIYSFWLESMNIILLFIIAVGLMFLYPILIIKYLILWQIDQE